MRSLPKPDPLREFMTSKGINRISVIAAAPDAGDPRATGVVMLNAASEARGGFDCQGRLSKPLDLDELRRLVRADLQAPGLKPGSS